MDKAADRFRIRCNKITSINAKEDVKRRESERIKKMERNKINQRSEKKRKQKTGLSCKT